MEEVIHKGNKYKITDVVTEVGASGTQLYLFKAPNTSKRIHMLIGVESSLGAKIQIFEAPTVNANGSVMDLINQERNSTNTATLLTALAANTDITIHLHWYEV